MEKNDAAEQFYHTYRSLIFRTAARLCRTQEDLDDLIQDSLLRFLQNLTYYTNRAPDETSALIVLTMQCQKVDTFRKLHPEKMGRLGGRGHRGYGISETRGREPRVSPQRDSAVNGGSGV